MTPFDVATQFTSVFVFLFKIAVTGFFWLAVMFALLDILLWLGDKYNELYTWIINRKR